MIYIIVVLKKKDGNVFKLFLFHVVELVYMQMLLKKLQMAKHLVFIFIA